MNYKDALKQESEILDQTYHSAKGAGYNQFVLDGLIDAKQYYSIPLRILIIAKESYSRDSRVPGGHIDDGFKYYCAHGGSGHNDPRNPALENASKWIHVVREAYAGNECPSDHATKPFRAQQLSTISWINLKRESNKDSVYCKDFVSELPYTAQFIKKQIDLYDPHVVLCGGTYDAVEKFLFDETDQSQKHNETVNGFEGVYSFERGNKTIVIKCNHPAKRLNSDTQDSQRHFIYSIIRENTAFLHNLVEQSNQ
ncbi:hypothetical protein [Schleiferilactobacillus harbinensis]|uniref:Uracil-DNA glycosylase-like domain-containing protein n=1 Tax=Schleiferilactobacillus harbinensis TaxID=304207 RepID=A0A5P8M626_9LACO|nr:hypothetical protein [Schleiferilactobacillus harbinensis]QFR23685.1 hypothetical protein D1010_09855 [Schleiferilactobacillus harbinensis]